MHNENTCRYQHYVLIRVVRRRSWVRFVYERKTPDDITNYKVHRLGVIVLWPETFISRGRVLRWCDRNWTMSDKNNMYDNDKIAIMKRPQNRWYVPWSTHDIISLKVKTITAPRMVPNIMTPVRLSSYIGL